MTGPDPQAVHVENSPVELPLGRHHIATVAIGRGLVRLDVRPKPGTHGATFELTVYGPLSVNGTVLDRPAAVVDHLDDLVEAGIVGASSTGDDGLEIELMSGRIVAEPGRWSLEASDGRRWQGHPGGGIAIWSAGDAEAGDASIDELTDDDDDDSERTETPVEIGRGIDLPGAGLHLVGMEVGLDGGISLTAHPQGAETPAAAAEEYDGPEAMEALQFFATLDVGPGTVPPDPEVFEAMKAAVERSDFGLGGHVWFTLHGVEPPAPEAAVATLAAMGSELASVHVHTDGRLEVAFADGLRLSARAWRLQTGDHDRWTGDHGAVVHLRWRRDYPRLSPADVALLAAAWLDHDRTGRKTRFWAWSRVDDVVRRQPMTGWLLVQRLIAGAADQAQLGSVAAGPLEDFLGQHSQVLLDRVEAAARADPRVMQALAGVWKNMINDDDWDRIQRLLGRDPA